MPQRVRRCLRVGFNTDDESQGVTPPNIGFEIAPNFIG